MKSSRCVLVVGLLIASFGNKAFAEDLGQGRLFLGSTKTAPAELNTELDAQGIKAVELNNSYGIEITFPVASILQAGLRYTNHLISLDEDPADVNTDYTAKLEQSSMMGIARIPFFKSDYVYLDVYGGIGAVLSSKYTLKTAGQDGSLEKGLTPNYAAGVSASFGYRKFYFTIEAGYEVNKIDGFKKAGNLNDNVTAMDLSGSYLTIGLMFDGVPVFKK